MGVAGQAGVTEDRLQPTWPVPPPALWQYPSQVGVESMVGLGALGALGGITGLGGLPAPPSGLQLVRDPATGTLLLIPPPTEQYQQAVVWSGYGGVGTGVLLPPLAPLQLLGTELLTSTTLHHHTQTHHSTRLVTLAEPRSRQPAPVPTQHPLSLLARPPTIPKQEEIITPPTGQSDSGFLLYQLPECRSRVSSPALTPPPENGTAPDVQDASNQTDTLSEEEDTQCNITNHDSDDVKDFMMMPQKLADIRIQTGDNNIQISPLILTDSSVQTKHEPKVQTNGFKETTNTDSNDSSRDSFPTGVACQTMPLLPNPPTIKYPEVSTEITSENGNIVIVVQAEATSADQNVNVTLSSDTIPISSCDNVKPNSIIFEKSITLTNNPETTVEVIQKPPSVQVDLSGLELLSNSIEQFETRSKSIETKPPSVLHMPSLDITPSTPLSVDVKNAFHPPPTIVIKSSPKSPKSTTNSEPSRFNFGAETLFKPSQSEDTRSLGGLGLLCALAEQRFMEEEEKRCENINKNNKTKSLNENTSDDVRPLQPIKKEKFDKSYSDSIFKSRPKDDCKVKIETEKSRIFNSDQHQKALNVYDFDKSEDNFVFNNVSDRNKTYEKGFKSSLNALRNERKSMDKPRKESFFDFKDKNGKKRNLEKSRSNSTSDISKFSIMDSISKYKSDPKCDCIEGEPHSCKNRNHLMNTMNAMERDMIMRLADLQRRYREKQRELSKLTPKKVSDDGVKRGPGRPRKKSTASDRGLSPSDLHDTYRTKPTTGLFSSSNFLDENNSKANSSLLKLSEDETSSLNDLSQESHHIRSVSPIADSNSSQSSIATLGSSKKRKVGRPKKLLSAPGSHIATETIVAKKPKSKSSLVGYLLAAKNRMSVANNKNSILYSKTSPPRSYEDDTLLKKFNKNNKGLKMKSLKKSDPNCYLSPSNTISEYKYPAGYDVKQKYASFLNNESGCSKMRPKLKAEPKLKEYSEEDEINNDWCSSQSNLITLKSHSSSMESLQDMHLKNKQKTDQLALKHKKIITPKIACSKKKRLSSDLYDSSDSEKEEVVHKKIRTNKNTDSSMLSAEYKKMLYDKCTLSLDELGGNEVRVLTAMGGLFYAGKLRAIQAPDVYAVNLDGERGNRPHIMSREETLRDTILEVCATSTKELLPGTRLCAYWSQQYRCLYPGTVADPATPDPLTDDKFVSVEFDDGDSGKIALEDIRLLQPDYPIVEYDLNPLLTLSKRKRQTSVNSIEEKKLNTSNTSNGSIDQLKPINGQSCKMSTYDTFVSASEQSQLEAEFSHRERKRLKKHKREKLKRLMLARMGDENSNIDDFIKKKKKKHKCCDEHCKHRKHHKKHHRKHKRHHHSSCKELSGSSSEDPNQSALLIKAFNQSSFFDIKDATLSISNPVDNKELQLTRPPIDHSTNENNLGNTNIVLNKKNKPNQTLKKIKITNKKTNLSKKSFNNLEMTGTVPVKKLKIIGKRKVVAAKLKVKLAANKTDENENKKIDEKPKIVKKAKKSATSTPEAAKNKSASKMAAFLPAGTQLWEWSGTGYRRPQAKGRARKCFYKSIHRANEVINVGDSAVFLSTGRPDRPYIGQIESMWEGWQGNMAVRVKWYYHPEETTGCPGKLTLSGGLFESPHTDENDVQTISHRCEVLPLAQYKQKIENQKNDNNDTYYLAGHYDPIHLNLTMAPDIPIQE